MRKTWFIGGMGLLAVALLGVVTFVVVSGYTPDLPLIGAGVISPIGKLEEVARADEHSATAVEVQDRADAAAGLRGGEAAAAREVRSEAAAISEMRTGATAANEVPGRTPAASDVRGRTALSPEFERGAPVRQSSLALSLSPMPMTSRFAGYTPVRLAAEERRIGGLSVPGEIDYRDPVEDGAVPLLRVWDRLEVPLSTHFTVRDFAARDGAAYARISPDLVDALEKIYEHLGAPLHINSAYRHPSLNFSASIGGAHESRHMAGLAADVWAEGREPLDIVEAALEVHGCHMGVGLGGDYVHIDLRGYTASWAYEDAEMAEADFDLWMLERCADSFGEQARLLAEQRLCLESLTGINAAEAYRTEMTAVARDHRRRSMTGAVLLDVRTGLDEVSDSSSVRMAFLPSDNPLVRLMGLEAVIQRAERNQNFVFVLIERDGAHRTGLMRYDGEQATPLDGSAARPASCG